MVQLSVSDVLRECNGTLYCGDENISLARFSKDTRTIQEGDVYLGIQGENFDGNAFYLDALQKGASCCILDSFSEETFEEKYHNRTIILVSDTIDAIQKLAAYKRSLIDIPVVAVTGSAGKTSTKDMIAEVLKQKYHVYKTPGNLNGQIGLPISILELQDEEVMVLEMGMNDFGHISKLTNIAKPTIGVITNIGTAHIGILGSRENILKAKMEILEGMEEGSYLVLNGDNDLLSTINLSNYHIVRCTMEDKDYPYRVHHISIEEQKSHYDVEYFKEHYPVTIPAMGTAFIMDSLLAIAVGNLLGVSPQGIQEGLQNFRLTGNRMEFIRCPKDITIINDTYNSNYEALLSALETLRQSSGVRKIAVLGDVLELEDYAKDIHYQIGSIPSLSSVDYLLLNGENARYIQDGAKDQGISEDKIFYFDNKKDLEDFLLHTIQSGDTILVKASNGMKFKEIVDKLKESYLV